MDMELRGCTTRIWIVWMVMIGRTSVLSCREAEDTLGRGGKEERRFGRRRRGKEF